VVRFLRADERSDEQAQQAGHGDEERQAVLPDDRLDALALRKQWLGFGDGNPCFACTEPDKLDEVIKQ